MEEKINNPGHYHPGTYEAIKVIEAWGLGFCLGNVVKYISRAGRKVGSDELEDLKKAAWYLNREIEKRENAVIGFDLKEGSLYTKNNLRDGFTIETSGTTAADCENGYFATATEIKTRLEHQCNCEIMSAEYVGRTCVELGLRRESRRVDGKPLYGYIVPVNTSLAHAYLKHRKEIEDYSKNIQRPKL